MGEAKARAGVTVAGFSLSAGRSLRWSPPFVTLFVRVCVFVACLVRNNIIDYVCLRLRSHFALRSSLPRSPSLFPAAVQLFSSRVFSRLRFFRGRASF